MPINVNLSNTACDYLALTGGTLTGGLTGIWVSLTLTPSVTAASQTLNAAPSAATLTAANTKTFVASGGNIVLPAITPAANGGGITLTGLNLSQGAITNAADSEAITVKQLVITGAAGAALATGVYTWTGADITMPAQAANAAINLAKGIKVTGGAAAGAASASQIGLDITMAAATDRGVSVNTGVVFSVGGYQTANLWLKDGTSRWEAKDINSNYAAFYAGQFYSTGEVIATGGFWGTGSATVTVNGNGAVDDATARSLILRVLDSTADAWLNMITLTPNAATPTITLGYITGVGGAPYATQPTGSLGVVGGVMIGGNSLNNLFDDASGGAGSTAMYIGTSQITAVSDIRIKTNITPTVFKAVDRLNSLRVIDFTWDDPTDRNPFGKNSRGRWTGISAQELIKVTPWVINAEGRNCPKCLAGETCTEHGMMFVEYENLVPVLVKAVQELSEEVNRLRKN